MKYSGGCEPVIPLFRKKKEKEKSGYT